MSNDEFNDVAEHVHRQRSHKHAWASHPHSHFMRAICNEQACTGCPTHDIHSKPESSVFFES
jgi:hypothetical protein